ncbi:MAG TPA: 50S ribosomal protein L23 [Candidatus Marinimicrobia bacterium]|jgi:large subunit ribosomal protein L23|nr:50S ribosomal protein L23 [Candidatus Neomarinimicrobiota bacterium]MDP5957940.1 50S ribosomal protein L23 [Candidatus Neomarinimicrobiota bacterium]MDP6229397.1 50S ribosomal protein L23 [Candidatus Neomarinimicrobiota bacterium]MDP7095177.1 50S ribosomal protein L23 [Candidatus Neomarinimicrobiota bacterium]MDP7512502.1 50S ribosomal protein L23 [Candidatus Neomarinimicrobiota bacterium]|tara:strand:+ start:219 stop:536 length:318 start_codon:yes stop_codon:yes gene_type:complete
MSVREIIIKPLFTEKLSQLEETQRKYAFQVDGSANKIEIKDAVEKRFDVIVAKVATMNRLGKAKQMTVRSGGKTIRTNGHRSNWKKAIITLKEGSTIDLIRGEVG